MHPSSALANHDTSDLAAPLQTLGHEMAGDEKPRSPIAALTCLGRAKSNDQSCAYHVIVT